MVITKRFDVALILEESMNETIWKGEDKTCGVFFIEDAGYCLNKILAIRIMNIESAPQAFYSFVGPPDDKVTIEYPYDEMFIKPKKHHLLTEETNILDFKAMFEVKNISHVIPFVVGDLIALLEQGGTNKRERNRTLTKIEFKDSNGIYFTIEKSKGEVLFSEMMNRDTEQKYIQYTAKLNTSTIYASLKIFPCESSVYFHFAHDKIKITGIGRGELNVEIVLGQMK